MGNKKGGGIGSKATHAPTTYFTGRPSTRINPKGVSQVGQSLGNRSMGNAKRLNAVESVRAGTVGGLGSVPLGNSVATNVGKGGPGAGRQVMPSGQQCCHGPANPGSPAPSKGPIFPGFK
jgi:hypothetical protein